MRLAGDGRTSNPLNVERIGLLLCLPFLFARIMAAAAPSPGPYLGCPEEGTPPGDRVLNILKNRTASVRSPKVWTLEDVLKLPIVPHRGIRVNWTAADTELIAPFEAFGVVLEGQIIGVKQENVESCNCRRKDLNDYHIWVAPLNASVSTNEYAIVVEATPRWKSVNPGWALRNFRKLARQQARVRITGWLMFDQDHLDQVGKTRATVWEIHPITKFEVFTGGRYREL